MYFFLYLIDKLENRLLTGNGNFLAFINKCSCFVVLILDHSENGNVYSLFAKKFLYCRNVTFAAVNGKTASLSVRVVDPATSISLPEKEGKPARKMSRKETEAAIAKLSAEMREAARLLEFEHAAYLRDKIAKLRESL